MGAASAVRPEKTVLLVDDNPDEAYEYERLFGEADTIRIKFINARPAIKDYADLVDDTATNGIILDQRLSEHSGVPYDGIDVARFLRSLSESLPIFILTNYYDRDLEERGEMVDLIISKRDVREMADVYANRILRIIERYRAIDDKEQLKEEAVRNTGHYLAIKEQEIKQREELVNKLDAITEKLLRQLEKS